MNRRTFAALGLGLLSLLTACVSQSALRYLPASGVIEKVTRLGPDAGVAVRQFHVWRGATGAAAVSSGTVADEADILDETGSTRSWVEASALRLLRPGTFLEYRDGALWAADDRFPVLKDPIRLGTAWQAGHLLDCPLQREIVFAEGNVIRVETRVQCPGKPAGILGVVTWQADEGMIEERDDDMGMSTRCLRRSRF